MKQNLLLIFILIVLAILSTSLVFVNLPLIFSLILFLFVNEKHGTYSFFFSGLILDLLGTAHFGYFVLLFTSLMILLLLLKKFLGTSSILKVALAIISLLIFFLVTSFPKAPNVAELTGYLLLHGVFFVVLFPVSSSLHEFFKGDLLSRNR